MRLLGGSALQCLAKYSRGIPRGEKTVCTCLSQNDQQQDSVKSRNQTLVHNIHMGKSSRFRYSARHIYGIRFLSTTSARLRMNALKSSRSLSCTMHVKTVLRLGNHTEKTCMTEIYLHYRCAHYRLSGDAPIYSCSSL